VIRDELVKCGLLDAERAAARAAEDAAAAEAAKPAEPANRPGVYP
jgi:hypothetical protein